MGLNGYTGVNWSTTTNNLICDRVLILSSTIFHQDTLHRMQLMFMFVRDGVKYTKYLYLKYLNTFFKVIESISNTLRKKVFVFVIKYITKVFEISNTFKYI